MYLDLASNTEKSKIRVVVQDPFIFKKVMDTKTGKLNKGLQGSPLPVGWRAVDLLENDKSCSNITPVVSGSLWKRWFRTDRVLYAGCGQELHCHGRKVES